MLHGWRRLGRRELLGQSDLVRRSIPEYHLDVTTVVDTPSYTKQRSHLCSCNAIQVCASAKSLARPPHHESPVAHICTEPPPPPGATPPHPPPPHLTPPPHPLPPPNTPPYRRRPPSFTTIPAPQRNNPQPCTRPISARPPAQSCKPNQHTNTATRLNSPLPMPRALASFHSQRPLASVGPPLLPTAAAPVTRSLSPPLRGPSAGAQHPSPTSASPTHTPPTPATSALATPPPPAAHLTLDPNPHSPVPHFTGTIIPNG